MSTPNPSQLNRAQTVLAKRLVDECGMSQTDSARLARSYRDDARVNTKADTAIVKYAQMLLDWDFPQADLADWVLASGLDGTKRRHLRRGYTPQQYKVVAPVFERREADDALRDLPEDRANFASWQDLLETVPPDFLALCVRIGASDDEIRDFDARRRNGDPDIVEQLNFQVVMLGNT